MVSRAQVSPVASYITLGRYAVSSAVEAFIGGALSVNTSHIEVTDLVLEPGARIGPDSASVNLRADLTATPSDSFSAAVVRHATCSDTFLI
jgi:PKD repeat protein